MAVLGPLRPDALGVTDAHDHLFLRSPALRGEEIEDLSGVMAEVEAARRSGIATIVEMTPIGCGRRPERLRAVSEATGVHVVASTGYHRDAHYPAGHWVYEVDIESLRSRIITDLVEGMHPADWDDPTLPLDPARAGVIKAGTSYHRITRAEERRLLAAAQAAVQTGAPILVHTEIGTCAETILEHIEREGVASQRIILAHVDRNPDLELHLDLAARGVFLEYDTIGRIKYRPDSDLLDLIEGVVAAGQADRLLLGLDLGRRSYFRVFDGGPGLTYLMAVFVPRLRRRVGDAVVHRILVENPARAFSIGPLRGPT
jgi:predicted metal-dependent phosphotriesterase family hydrolase